MRLRWPAVAAPILAWQLFVPSGDYVAPPSEVLSAGLPYLADPETVTALTVTTIRFLAAFAISKSTVSSPWWL